MRSSSSPLKAVWHHYGRTWTSVLLIVIGPLLVANSATASTGAARRQVQLGLRHYRSGDFAAADKAFQQAQAELPDDPRVAFDRACALAAQDKHDEAADLFRAAALARDETLSSESHYNLGCIAAAKAKAVFGSEPVEAAPEQREEGLESLRQAVAQYRRCLEINPQHEKARHNIELTRLWIKHMLDTWERRDRQRQREQMDTLQFLEMIQQRQQALRMATRELEREADSPRRRQALGKMADSQRQLAEELPVLAEKIRESVNSAVASSPAGTPAPDQQAIEQAVSGLTQFAESAQRSMYDAATQMATAGSSAAIKPQTHVLDELNQLFMQLAPLEAVLQKSIQRQQELVEQSDTIMNSEDETSTADADVAPDYEELSRQQSRISQWAATLPAKAEAQLAQLPAADANPPPSPAPPKAQLPIDDDAQAASAADSDGETPAGPQPDVASMKEAFEKAIELAPEIEQLATEATDDLDAQQVPAAQPKQQRALELLREIAKSLSQQQQEQQQQDQNQQDQQQDRQQDENKGDQGDQQQSDQDQDKESDESGQQDQPQEKPDDESQKSQEQQTTATATKGTTETDERAAGRSGVVEGTGARTGVPRRAKENPSVPARPRSCGQGLVTLWLHKNLVRWASEPVDSRSKSLLWRVASLHAM